MDVTTLTFGIKDVVAIVLGVITIISFMYAIKNSNERNNTLALKALQDASDLKKDMDEKFLHAKNAKKANIDMIYQEITKVETEMKLKISEIRMEQKESQEKLNGQINVMSVQLTAISNGVAELTGYMRAQKDHNIKS